MSGCLTQVRAFLHILPTVIGYSPMMGGCGFLNIPGDGPLSIMAAGITIHIMDPCGFRITIGALVGLRGEDQATITDGLP